MQRSLSSLAFSPTETPCREADLLTLDFSAPPTYQPRAMPVEKVREETATSTVLLTVPSVFQTVQTTQQALFRGANHDASFDPVREMLFRAYEYLPDAPSSVIVYRLVDEHFEAARAGSQCDFRLPTNYIGRLPYSQDHFFIMPTSQVIGGPFALTCSSSEQKIAHEFTDIVRVSLFILSQPCSHISQSLLLASCQLGSKPVVLGASDAAVLTSPRRFQLAINTAQLDPDWSRKILLSKSFPSRVHFIAVNYGDAPSIYSKMAVNGLLRRVYVGLVGARAQGADRVASFMSDLRLQSHSVTVIYLIQAIAAAMAGVQLDCYFATAQERDTLEFTLSSKCINPSTLTVDACVKAWILDMVHSDTRWSPTHPILMRRSGQRVTPSNWSDLPLGPANPTATYQTPYAALWYYQASSGLWQVLDDDVQAQIRIGKATSMHAIDVVVEGTKAVIDLNQLIITSPALKKRPLYVSYRPTIFWFSETSPGSYNLIDHPLAGTIEKAFAEYQQVSQSLYVRHKLMQIGSSKWHTDMRQSVGRFR